MTERKWTAGPWVFDGTGPHKVFGCEINDSLGDCIAGSWHGKDDTARANAHLIAAAPDLYEALEELLRYEPQGVVECRGDKCREPWCASCWGWESATLHVENVETHFKSARAALAKARGEVK